MRTNEKLLQWRLAQKLSQREAADLAEVSQPTWQSYEAGSSKPRVGPAGRIQRLTRGHIKVSEWSDTAEDRAVRKARAAARRVPRRTGTDG